MKNNFKVIGMMSGTSLDGLDLAYCEFTKTRGRWDFSILYSEVVRYPRVVADSLAIAHKANADQFLALDVSFGRFLGKACREFIQSHQVSPDFIASHGHTVFHQPQRGFTAQIGNGNAIHAETGVPVICDFRSLDVLMGGQGAPLVPAGDQFLFSDFDICLNLGGIANLSAKAGKERKAFDICFCNMTLNFLMNSIGKKFDRGGVLSATGEVNAALLSDLRKASRPWKKRRPSLGREMFEVSIVPLLRKRRMSLQDKLATCTEATAIDIVEAAQELKGKSLLCTGGGAFNSFLVSRILQNAGDSFSIIIPDEVIVKFKEAMVFAFLGVLRARGEVNCFRSVTGASADNSGGVMIGF